MKFVALLSGGKDSCYNIVHCTANGHELVVAASLKPPAGQGEIDSFMYQTVGQDAIEFVAGALDVPLFRRTIHGSAVEQGGEYGDRAGRADRESEGVSGDETEDMLELLSEVKEAHPDIQGVSVGAILSNYQRVRVDHVCQRLGLTPLCYLWQRDQRELMSEMIAAGVEAILIKVAGIGLKEQHLGKTLAQMEPTFHKLNDNFGAHICGEGGEYETLTLDCPAFKKRITIKETEIVVHSDHSFATVAYLQIRDAVLEDKPQTTPSTPAIPLLLSESAAELEQSLVEQKETLGQESRSPSKDLITSIEAQVTQQKDWIFISNVQDNSSVKDIPIEDEVVSCFETIKDLLRRSDLNLQPKHIVNTMLLLSDMGLFPRVNKAYAQYFGTSPPSRACVAVDLPEGTRVRVSCVAYKDHPTSNPRSGLHVQGISYWAPANIGPYSQAITTRYQTFVSGQIGLIPAQMSFPSPPSFATEAALAFQHADRILDALKDESTSVLQGVIVWVAGEDKLELGRRAWNAYTQVSKRGDDQVPAVIVAAKSLPKDAMIEVQVLAHSNTLQSTDSDDDDDRNLDSKLDQVSNESDVQANYECKIRRIGDTSSFIVVFANNSVNLSNGLPALPPLLRQEVLVVTAFYRSGVNLPPSKATYIPVRGILSPSGVFWDAAFCIHAPVHSKSRTNCKEGKVEVWAAIVDSDGMFCEEYDITGSDKRSLAECWIPAVDGQTFEIQWFGCGPDSYSKFDIRATPYLNGVEMDCGILSAKDRAEGDWGWLDGQQVDVDKTRPFQFGQLELTDDDDLVVNTHSEPYTIRVKLEWGSSKPQKLSRRSGRHSFDCPEIISLLPKNEALTGNFSSVVLGEPVASDAVLEMHTFRVRRPRQTAEFVFYYAPMDWLRANAFQVQDPNSNNDKEVIDVDEIESDSDLPKQESVSDVESGKQFALWNSCMVAKAKKKNR